MSAISDQWRTYPAVLRVMRHAFLDALPAAVSWPDRLPFVITGDIPAMWLRDSSGQLEPYVRFVDQDENLAQLVEGVIRRQALYITIDPYANAFNAGPSGKMSTFWDQTQRNRWVFERKFSLDSLAYPVRLWWLYWKKSGRHHVIRDLRPAIEQIVQVMETEACHAERSAYRFHRFLGGRRNHLTSATAPAIGLLWSGFRPSDDAVGLCYNIPGQMMAAVCLDMVVEWSQGIFDDVHMAERARGLRDRLIAAVAQYGTFFTNGQPHWAYEVDGRGAMLIMDDANIPSLLAAPFLFFCSPEHETYRATRRLILSARNPYWHRGRFLEGIGSSHTPKHRIWPMAVIMEAITEGDRNVALTKLAQVAAADAGTGWIHESVDGNRPWRYTRPWFGWANALFSEAVLQWSGWPNPIRAPLIK